DRNALPAGLRAGGRALDRRGADRARAGGEAGDDLLEWSTEGTEDTEGAECCAPGRTSTLNADELRALQAPLKERYRAEPEAALITLRAQGTLGEGITCKVATGK